jgi:hypothetical protein
MRALLTGKLCRKSRGTGNGFVTVSDVIQLYVWQHLRVVFLSVPSQT